jgi:hypothetical protein
MPYFVPRNKIREIARPKFRNEIWENWGFHGLIPGVLLMSAGLTISVIEIIRIVYGVTNRGIRKHDSLVVLIITFFLRFNHFYT